MSATDELYGQLDTGYPHTLRPELHKALMDRGIDYWVAQGITFWNRDDGCECLAYGYQACGVPKLAIKVVGFTDPEQAIEATLGRGTCQKVYLVETSDDLIESWYPIGVYLNSKAAEDCAEALRGEVDGIRQFARVVELKVVGE